MHSIRITFMPDKESVPYRNSKKHHMGDLSISPHLVLYVQHEYRLQYVILCATCFIFHDISE